MAALRTLAPRTALTSLLPHLVYTLSRLRAHPLGAPHVPAFEALRAAWTQVFLQEVAIIEATTNAQARVDAAGAALDHEAGVVAKATLTITHDDRRHPLYLHLFAQKTLSSFRRPLLGAQLAAMKGWRMSLPQCGQPALAALMPEVEAALAEAEGAAQAQSDARAENRRFRDVGARRQFVDALNAARKELHGALSKLPHLHAGLASGFAEEFFLRDGGGREEESAGEAQRTPEALRGKIAGAREALAQMEAELAALEAAEAAAAARRAAEARAADEARLREVQRAMAEMEAQRAALEARLAGAAG